jgi:hypothetical protein
LIFKLGRKLDRRHGTYGDVGSGARSTAPVAHLPNPVTSKLAVMPDNPATVCTLGAPHFKDSGMTWSFTGQRNFSTAIHTPDQHAVAVDPGQQFPVHRQRWRFFSYDRKKGVWR